MKLKLLVCAALSCLWSGAAAERVVLTNSFRVAGQSKVQPTDSEKQIMTLSLYTARNLLAGVDSGDLDTFPCVENDVGVTLIEGNDLKAYAAIKASLVAEGWSPLKEVKLPSPLPNPVYAFQYQKGSVTVMGLWAQRPAGGGTRSRLSICQQAKNWKPKPEVKPAPLAESAPTAGKLPAVLKFTFPGWEDPAGVLHAADAVQGRTVLTMRGTVNARGEVALTLRTPDAGVLRPVQAWYRAFVVGSSTCTKGKITISNPQAKIAVVSILNYVAVPASSTDAQVLKAKGSYEDMFVSQQFKGAYALRTRLVYASAPVRIQGTPACSDSSITKVDLNLPAGWSVVYDRETQKDFRSQLVNAPAEAAYRNWSR